MSPDDREAGADGGGKPGLAWPDHDTGPVPPRGYRDRRELVTRKPMSLWDRTKFLLALVILWTFFFWGALSDNPIISTRDAFWETLDSKWWILALIVVEALRQLHYSISEHSAEYHAFWTESVFGAVERRFGRVNDWNRYRISRALKVAAALILLDIVLAALFDVSPATALYELPSRLADALPFVFQLVFYFFLIIFQFVGLFWFLSRGGVDVYFPDDIKTRFSDVWGQDAVLDRVKENMLFLEAPERVEDKGGYVPGGILLWGPPGTGKTLMAEAVAGETGRPFVFVDPGAFINMFMGVGILKVKSLFRKLRKLAIRYGGVIVFFDEADALGNRGALQPGGVFGASAGPWSQAPSCRGASYLSNDSVSLLMRETLASAQAASDRRPIKKDRIIMGGMGGGGGMGTLQSLLSELSGLKKPRGLINRYVRRLLGMRPKPPPKYRILVMMATNMPQALDEALLRPGRIDRIYKVGYPSKEGRKRTYEGYLEKVRHGLTPEQIDKLAVITPYATGASIKDLVNEALIIAIRAGREEISWQDVIKAKHLKALGPPDDVEYIERERHAIAVHEACHAVVAYRERHHWDIDIATIEKGGDYLGMVASVKLEDQFTQWRTEFEADIMVSLASLAGERMFFDGDNSSGVSQDLENATQLSTLMEGYWGMGSTIASHGVTQRVGIGGGRRGEKREHDDRDLLKGTLGQRIEDKLEELYKRTQELLRANRIEVLAVTHALEAHKTLSGEDVEAVIEGREGPIVDGRPYATPEFAEQAKAYHALAVAAHKGHGHVEIPLPVFNGQGARPLAQVGAGDPWEPPSDVIDPRPPEKQPES